MSIDIIVLFTVLFLILGLYQIINILSADKSKDNDIDLTTIVMLENISEDTKTVKTDTKKIKGENTEIVARLDKVETSAKRTNERLDDL